MTERLWPFPEGFRAASLENRRTRRRLPQRCLNIRQPVEGGGSFKIDDPLDPENKYLYHAFVESPDMKNIYDGTYQPIKTGKQRSSSRIGLRH